MIEPFEPHDIPGKPWGRELVFAHTADYLGKVLWMNKGHGGHLQYHERKDETFFLLSGSAQVNFHDAAGQLVSRIMLPGESYHVPPGAVHQVIALEDSILVEASNPVFEDRVIVKKMVAPLDLECQTPR
jgi:mannose-6-phosphate isomerase-like protein (cupin superfamily)